MSLSRRWNRVAGSFRYPHAAYGIAVRKLPPRRRRLDAIPSSLREQLQGTAYMQTAGSELLPVRIDFKSLFPLAYDGYPPTSESP